MVVAEGTRLGGTLEALIQDQRVTIAHVVRQPQVVALIAAVPPVRTQLAPSLWSSGDSPAKMIRLVAPPIVWPPVPVIVHRPV